MKILFDNIIYSLQTAGGISVVWSELIARALNDTRIEASFIEQESKNIFRHDLRIPKNKIIRYSNAIIPVYINRYINPKITCEHNLFHSSYYRINRNSKIKNITTIHDFTYEFFKKGFRRYVHSKQKEYAILNSECIICVSENTKRDLRTLYPQIDESRVEVVHNGVSADFRKLHNVSSDQSVQLTKFSNYSYALYIGDRKSEYKNFDAAIEACAEVKVPFVMVGGGLLTQKEIKTLDSSLGNLNYQHLAKINTQKLNILYNFALCLLYPSKYEGFGIPLIEAQKCGCLVIASKSSSIPEVAGSGAILIKDINARSWSSALFDVKKDKQYIAEIKEEGYTNASKYSWEKCYEETRQIYSKLHE